MTNDIERRMKVDYETQQHIGWLKQYVFGMTSENWRDMRDRCVLQLNELSALQSGGKDDEDRASAGEIMVTVPRGLIDHCINVIEHAPYTNMSGDFARDRDLALSQLRIAICRHEKTDMGFGLAGGGYGAYEYCEDCGIILHKTQEPNDGTWNEAITEIAAERKRQIGVEAFDTPHDDEHHKGELALAAACYASPKRVFIADEIVGRGYEPFVRYIDAWPWHDQWWKPKDRRRDLIKAAALIVAEIERLDRAKRPTQEQEAGT